MAGEHEQPLLERSSERAFDARQRAPIASSQSSVRELLPDSSNVHISSRTTIDDHRSGKRVSHRKHDGSRRQKPPRVWKKILWVKQSYPDNYTDPDTFLSHLQWNPKIEAYRFWPLVVNSTVIVQHVSSVIIFICCFVGIYRERVPPTSLVSWSSICTFVCWLLSSAWIGHDGHAKQMEAQSQLSPSSPSRSAGFTEHDEDEIKHTEAQSHDSPTGGIEDHVSPKSSADLDVARTIDSTAGSSPSTKISRSGSPSFFSSHQQQRLATIKSALLIYSALLGLSPILKSLTKSTTSDSIWALSVWLILVNVLFYDYGSEGNDQADSDMAGVRYQSSLSTNAALMASTVLASRLKSTTHVFSLTLFSIEVFGLFPVFRRQVKQRSRLLHISLTALLVCAAGSGLGLVLDDHGPEQHTWALVTSWQSALTGAILWSSINMAAMGGCSWWLISLQKYKDVVIGPWDPAKPVVRGRTG